MSRVTIIHPRPAAPIIHPQPSYCPKRGPLSAPTSTFTLLRPLPPNSPSDPDHHSNLGLWWHVEVASILGDLGQTSFVLGSSDVLCHVGLGSTEHLIALQTVLLQPRYKRE